ncbi:MAG TPA: glycoside hydrolase family 2 TIM barrel-domain containing protein [Phycisphaerae bacterium]|nr:glycoside hydrolase family 2 TIM barrel-domain containing protein [Phycisphaerae bacterium]HUT61821.1 glycoside hydrolase family 2 TIM barrel-domain containing protein [Phycisphaerae bacterium]
MYPYTAPFAIAALCVFAACAAGGELVLDHQRDAVNLAGTWKLLLEHGDRDVWKPQVAAKLGPWKPVQVPASSLMTPDDGDWKAISELHKNTKYVWIRRSFELDAAHSSRGAVLKWGGIRFGAKAWINGKEVADHVPVGPHTALLPTGTLKAGRNEIVLRIPGWAGVPKSASGYPLTPTGGATQSWGGKGPAVYQDIWLELYDRAYAKWVLAMPNVAEKSVTFRVWLDAAGPLPESVSLAAAVREPGKEPVLGRASKGVSPTKRPAAPADITCSLKDFKPWTPQTPHLCEAEVRVTAGGKTCDTVRFRFGMRQITNEGGHFRLNGRPLWLRGSNLVNEWLWGDRFNENCKQYIIDEARSMSLNCFRTHTQPPPPTWLNVADTHGMMILAEMPLLYNHGDFKYTPEELEVVHRNALLDATGWVTRMWNHPSIVIWVISNESRYDKQWESTKLFNHVKRLDPTRLIMRTGDEKVGTPDMVDVHTCFNVVRGPEGELLVNMSKLMAAKDANRPLTNTEYMNHMWDPSGRWLGRQKHPDFPLAYAECAAEHTEAMRRLQFDCLLPYMYAGWTRLRGKMSWRNDYPTPMAAALHSVMSPVLASIETFDRNYVAGEKIETGLMLINETHDDVAATLDLYVTPHNPLFVPDANALKAAIWRESMPLKLAADSIARRMVQFAVPEKECTYYLAAVLRREGDTPVVSQRTVRAIDPDKTAAALKGLRVLLLGADDTSQAWLKRRQCQLVPLPKDGKPAADVALVWDAVKLTEAERGSADALRRFAQAGGRIVVADQQKWAWKELADCRIGLPEFKFRNPVICSRAHAHEGVEHQVLRDIPAEWLWRWNGLPGTIANEVILEGPALENGRKILWVSRPIYTAVLSLPVGKGEIVFCQLKLRDRVSPDSKMYDPAAERVLMNLLRK